MRSGSAFGQLTAWLGRTLVAAIVIAAVAVAVMGDSGARSLAVTAFNVGGTGANIVIRDAIPAFFESFSEDDGSEG